MADAIAVTAAFADSARPPDSPLRTYVTDWRHQAEPFSLASADVRLIPRVSRAAWFRHEDHRWIPEPAIAERLILREPHGFVDLVTRRGQPDGGGLGGSAPAESHLRTGGYLLLLEPSATIPEGMRRIDDEGRLFQKVAPFGEGAHSGCEEDATDPSDHAESFASYQRQQDLVALHLNLARSLARRFMHRGEAGDDLEQVAFLSLVKAARRYDPNHEAAFSTYATVSILGELKRHFRDKTWMLRVPRSTQELYLSIKDAREELGHRLGASPTVSEIAAHMGVGVDDVLEAMEAGGTYWPDSLDVCGSDGERTVDIPVVDDSFNRAVDRQQLLVLMPRLDERERVILKRIYFDGETQQHVAQEIGASQMQVSRLLAHTLAKLRKWCQDDHVTLAPDGD